MRKIKLLLAAGLMAGCLFGTSSAKSLETAVNINLEEIKNATLTKTADAYADCHAYQELKKESSLELDKLYEMIDGAVKAFDEEGKDAVEYNGYYIVAGLNIWTLKLGNGSSIGLNVQKVFNYYKLDHPECFWLSSFFAEGGYDDNNLELCCDEKYAEASVRAAVNAKIEEEAQVYLDYVKDCTDTYSTVTSLVYLMAMRNDYAFTAAGVPSNEYDDHCIVGIMADDHTAVCEGYAKSIQLLLNRLGIANIFVVGQSSNDGGSNWANHAWNMVLMEDGNYYYFDPTWSDCDRRNSQIDNDLEDFPYRMRYTYHLKGKSFESSHRAFTPDGAGLNTLYAIPEVPDTDYVPTVAGILPREEFSALAGSQSGPSTYYYEDDFVYGDEYTFIVMQNDGVHRQVEILGISNALKESEELVIPEEITYDGVKYKVCGVMMGAFDSLEADAANVTLPDGTHYVYGVIQRVNSSLEDLMIPESVGFMLIWGTSSDFYTLSKINIVAEEGTEAEKFANSDTEDRYEYKKYVAPDPGIELSLTVYDKANDPEITVTGIEDGGKYTGEVEFTVTSLEACMVLATTDGGETYTRLDATATDDKNTYSYTFTMQEGLQLVIAKAGDVDLDGLVNANDAMDILKFDVKKIVLNAIQKMLADVTEYNKINANDAMEILKKDVKKVTISW